MSGAEPLDPEFSGDRYSRLGPSDDRTSATDVFRAQPDDASFETDFADLAARFAQKSGGGLSPELSADLALEVVLNEIVEQACLATGATGAAIVLERDAEMVCRATSGATAPELGARLDTATGLSGECVKTRRLQRCDDVLGDERVDLEASARLGVRSVLVMPLVEGEKLVGVFELFSSQPAAFSERDEGTLEVLAGRALSNLERAARPLAAPVEASQEIGSGSAAETRMQATEEVQTIEEVQPEMTEATPRGSLDLLTWAVGAAALACVLVLGVSLGRHLGAGKRTVPGHAARPVAASVPAANGQQASSLQQNSVPDQSGAAKVGPAAPLPPGGLAVYDKGKEVFRMTPPARKTGGVKKSEMQPASAVEPENAQVMKLSPAAVEDRLVKRVEPEYPEQARQQKIQGSVVLDVRIAADGTVQDVQVVSGAAPLAQASTDAVKQWRFKPQVVNGRAVEMETRVTLNFRLPG